MDKLPQETVDHILAYVFQEGVSLAPLASVSNKFQSIETYLFSSIEVDSRDIDAFNSIMVGRRRSHLKSISYVITLHSRFGSPVDHARSRNIFSTAAGNLFKVLNSWVDEGVWPHPGVRWLPLAITVRHRWYSYSHSKDKHLKDPLRTAQDSEVCIRDAFAFPLAALYLHPSHYRDPISDIPFRQFGISGLLGDALWRIVSGDESVQSAGRSSPNPMILINLQHLNIEFTEIAPTSERYFSYSNDGHAHSNEARIDPIVIAFARACLALPRLKSASLTTRLQQTVDRRWRDPSDSDNEDGFIGHRRDLHYDPQEVNVMREWGLFLERRAPARHGFYTHLYAKACWIGL